LRRLEREAEQAGRAELFASLRPFVVDAPEDPDNEAVAQAHGLRRNTVAVAVHRMRARLQELVHEVLTDTARGKEDVAEELRHLREVFAPSAKKKA
jgi:RNA polymerase sigma-70 factor (ECF subfamily)